jgi:DNA-binding response OmpR family regulator
MTFERDTALRRVHDRIGELEETVRQLKQELEGAPLVFDLDLRLTKTETAVLEVLARRAPRVVSRMDLFAVAWGESEADVSVVSIYIHRLRVKITKREARIQTRWGQGWFIQRADVEKLLARTP